MRRFSALFCAFIALALIGLTACGGGNNSTVFGNAATINFSPASTSLTLGTFENGNISVVDSKGNVLFSSGGAAATNVTFTSSDPNVLQISNNGLICAGKWDSLVTPVVCSPGNVGSATVSVTSGGVSATPLNFFVHAKIERVDITGAPADVTSCISQGATVQLAAKALAGDGSDITSTVGPPTWTVAIPDIVTIDANSVATAQDPGQTGLSANFGNFRGGSVPFTVCPVKSINIHVKGATDTSLALDPSGTATLTADVVDTNNHTIIISKASATSTTAGLTWSTTAPSATVTGLTTVLSSVTADSTNDATVTASRAGATSIVASCTPPLCNASVPTPSGTAAGLTPVYSNIVTETTSGTTSTLVLVTGTDTTQLVPINTASNTPGTILTLSNQPNSLLIGKDAAHAFLGSAGGLMVVDANAVTLTSTLATVPGKALAVNPTDGKTVVVSDTANSRVFVGDATTGAFLVFPIANVTAAAYSIDGYRLSLASPTAVTVITQGSANNTRPFGATAVSPHPGGQVSYFASNTNVQVVATCDPTQVSTVTVPSATSLVQALANGSQALVAGPNLLEALDISIGPGASGCPPAVTNNPVPLTMTGTPTQIIGTSNGARAFVLNDTANIIAYDAASHTVSTIPTSSTTGAFAGGVTLDGTQLYIGVPGSTPVIHRIDLTTNTDAQQITASTTAFTPNLVAVRP